MDVVKKLKNAVEKSKEVPLTRRRAVLQEELLKTQFSATFSIPLDPT